MKRIHEISAGVPRLVNVICDRSLLGAYARNRPQVTWSLVRRAAREGGPDGPEGDHTPCHGDDVRELRDRGEKTTIIIGAREKDLLILADELAELTDNLEICTDDGSAGHHGLVTDLLRPLVEESPRGCRIVCCGPEPMPPR